MQWTVWERSLIRHVWLTPKTLNNVFLRTVLKYIFAIMVSQGFSFQDFRLARFGRYELGLGILNQFPFHPYALPADGPASTSNTVLVRVRPPRCSRCVGSSSKPRNQCLRSQQAIRSTPYNFLPWQSSSLKYSKSFELFTCINAKCSIWNLRK